MRRCRHDEPTAAQAMSLKGTALADAAYTAAFAMALAITIVGHVRHGHYCKPLASALFITQA